MDAVFVLHSTTIISHAMECSNVPLLLALIDFSKKFYKIDKHILYARLME